MRLLGVELENYGSFWGKHAFRLVDRGLTLVLGENLDEPRMNSNGAAKSTLFESVDWCWYGKPPKGDHVDSVVNEEAKDCCVTTYLQDDDGRRAVIRRTRPPGLQFWLDDTEQTFLDAAETQEAVTRFLGMSREVFHAAVFFGQNDLMRFADVGEARRMELLSQIIPEMGEVDRLLEVVKDRHADTASSVMRAQNELADVTGQLGALNSLDYQTQRDEWERKRQADIQNLHARAAQLHDYWSQHQQNLARLPRAQAELEVLKAQSFPQPFLAPEHKELGQLRVDACIVLAACDERRKDAVSRYSRARDLSVGECGECGQVVTGEYLAQRVMGLQVVAAQHEREVKQQEKKIAELSQKIAESNAEYEKQLGVWKQQEMAHKQRVDALYNEVSALSQLKTYCDQAERDLGVCSDQARALGDAVNPFDEQIRSLEQKRNDLEHLIEVKGKVLASAEQALQYLDFWWKAFGPKGLKSYILDSKIQEMTDSVNHWVKVLTGGTFWVKFSTQKQGRSTKKLSNEFSIKVYRYNADGRVSERNYQSWSGGEKGRVSLAIDMGLSRLIAQRAAKRYDVLILDELFKHVDRDGGEAIADMLGALKHEKSSVFVVEHDAEFQSRFENRVLIRRQGARSTIVEVDSDTEPAETGKRRGKGETEAGGQARKKKPKRTPVRSAVSVGPAASRRPGVG
jgi:DNA repair exonuclease SbcCD ATPase subunit